MLVAELSGSTQKKSETKKKGKKPTKTNYFNRRKEKGRTETGKKEQKRKGTET